MVQLVRHLVHHRADDGASAVEYGLLIAGIAALIVAVVLLFGGAVASIFSGTCGKVSTAVANGSPTSTATC